MFRSVNRLTNILIPVFICLFLGVLYIYTLAPGLTWVFDSADSGDLVTAAAMGGVPHPSGYPTYLLLASLFLKIPFGSLAYRTNLLSCVCTVATALMIYKIMRTMDQSVFSAAIASMAFGTFQLVWSQAIITEVNALNALFTAFLFYFFILSSSQPLMDVVGGVVGGLGLGNHLTIIFMLPLMFVDKARPEDRAILGGFRKQSFYPRIRFVARRLVGLCLGLSVYLIIPFRASAHAPVNWGNAVNLDGLIWLVTGRIYWARLDYLNGDYIMAGVQAWSHFLIGQLGIFGLLLVIIVLALLFKPSRFYLASGWLVLIYSIFSILYYSPDSYVYLIPVLISFSIWMGLASVWIVERISSKFYSLKLPVMIGILAWFLLRTILAIPAMDLSTDRKAELFARTVLDSAPARAVILTEGDEATFSLWYFHYANHQRPDISIVSTDLLIQPWYHTVLKYTYPDLIIADNSEVQDIIRDNPQRPICMLGTDLQTLSKCSTN